MPDQIITPNQQPRNKAQEQIIITLLNQFNILTMEFDTLFEMVCDTEEKKQAYKEKFKVKMDEYLAKVKSSQIKQKIMQK